VAVDLSVQTDAERTTSVARVQQPLPRGAGVGYRFEGVAGDVEERRGELLWQGDSGRMEARFEDGAQRHTTGSVTVSGALVAAGGGLFLSRPVRDGFAIVEVPSVPGIRVNYENQEVGRTGRGGRLLVPDLLPYQANRLSITPSDVPLDYDVGALERVVAPTRRGAAHVRFDVEKVRSLTGTLTIDLAAGRVTPAYGELTVAGVRGGSSPIASDGRFYLERVPPGRHRAMVVYGGGVCEVALEVPERSGLVLDLGPLRCAQRAALSGGAAGDPPAVTSSEVGPPSASTVTTNAPALASAASR
jgi:outer membrane usher protein